MARVAEALRKEVHRANLALGRSGLVMGTFGNVSGVDRAAGLMAIKPSGVPYDRADGRSTSCRSRSRPARSWTATCGPRPTRRPTSSSTAPSRPAAASPTRHSESATALAQAGLPVRCLGTTHADHFRGDVPVTRALTRKEVAVEYEKNTGLVIVETFRKRRLSPEEIAAVLVPATGRSPGGRTRRRRSRTPASSSSSARMEILVRAAEGERPRRPGVKRPADFLVDKHYRRKHGKGSYYGQK